MKPSLLATLFCAVTLLPATGSPHNARADDGAASNWPAPNGDSNETAYSRLNSISTANIGSLNLAWSLDLPGQATLEATPLAIGGTLYFTGSYAKVYAVDGATGKLLWTFDPETWKFNPAKLHYSFAANRGVAYDNGRIFSAALDGRLFALDAKTGKLLWTAETVTRDSPQDITGAPRTFDNKVIIGNSGGDFGARGYVTAYDQNTGKQLWRFYTVPGTPAENKGHPAMEKAAATWGGDYWKTGTGGAVWDDITFDKALGRIYIGVGNPSPYDPSIRSPGNGVNLYADSIVALDAATGKYIWHYQINPRDAWDFDSTQQMTLADLTIGGKTYKVLMQAPKDGFFYVIDRETGKPLSAGKIGKVTWADHIDIATGRPAEEKDIRYETGQLYIFPSSAGAHSWMAMSYDPQTGLVYIPYMQMGAHYVRGHAIPGGFYVGGLGLKDYEAESDPHDGKGALLAWNPVTEKPVWEDWHAAIWNGGVMSTAGGLVFQGTADGYFSAYDATTGKRLWRFNAGGGIIGAPMSYSVGGKQYVSVLVGYGGSSAVWGAIMNVGWKWGAQPRRLLTFALNGHATLPPSPGPDLTVHALDNPSIKLNPADVAAGHTLFLSCAICHGRNLVSSGSPAPDLRESSIALNPASFWSVVHNGALLPAGMPQFQDLTHEQVMQIWAYIRAGAREALAKQKVQSPSH